MTSTTPTDETATPPLQQGPAVYFDGVTSRKRAVTLHFADTLEIVEDGLVLATWPYGAIRRVDGPPSRLRLGCANALPLARLDVEDSPTIAAVIARSPSLDVDRGGPRQTWRILFWSLAAVGSILAVAIYGIPLAADRLAPLVPYAVERRVGEAVDPQVRLLFGGKTCTRPEGQAAFDAMIDKLKTAGGFDLPLRAEVIGHELPNAFALPGGKIYLMDGLLQKARSADEIAGVLAHELGHVQHRDSMRLLIQTGGTSFLIGLLLGDVLGGSAVIFATRSMLNASYSREAEQDADAFAVMVMQKLGRSAVPMGEFLLRVTSRDSSPSSKPDTSSSKSSRPSGRGFTIFDSHPVTEDRLAAMRKQERPITGPEILSESEWRALKEICGTK